MRLVLFEPVDGVVFVPVPAGTTTIEVEAVSTDGPAEPGPVSRVCLTLPEPRIPAGAVPATDSRGRVVGYVEESP